MKQPQLLTFAPQTSMGRFIKAGQRLIKVSVSALLLAASITTAQAQTPEGIPINPDFFGINYWYSRPNASTTTNLKTARVTLYRLGGNARNNEPQFRYKESWEADIEYIKYNLNGEPIVQLPIGLPPSEVAAWVRHFNVTKNYGIKYWTIGNEPDPGGGLSVVEAWVNGTRFNQNPTNGLPNNFNYAEWEARFTELAKQLKLADANAKIVGPDFRLFYREAISLHYTRFLNALGTQSINGLPLLDTFAFHYYDSNSTKEVALAARFDQLQALLDGKNPTRRTRGWADLRMAVTEVNGEASAGTLRPWNFSAGQFLATTTKLALSKRAFCVAPWSIYESSGNNGPTDFSLYNTDNSRRPTMHHFAMISENQRANYMPGEQNGYRDDIVFLGMREQGVGYTIMLMNTSLTARTYNVAMNYTYQGTQNVKIRMAGYDGNTIAPLTGTIASRTTLLIKFNATGGARTTLSYTLGEGAPSFQQSAASAAVAAGGEAEASVISVHPNPATSKVTLAGMPEKGAVTLRSVAGKVYLKQQVDQAETLDISSVPAGVYILTITTAKGQVNRKLIKQ